MRILPARIARFGTTAILVAIALGGCAPVMSPSHFDEGTPRMRPEVFFSGITHSTGVIEDRIGAPTRRLQVEGHGSTQPDGSFRLDQAVTLGHDLPRLSSWVMHRMDDHRYVATLTDATGPVECEAFGDLFHIRAIP